MPPWGSHPNSSSCATSPSRWRSARWRSARWRSATLVGIEHEKRKAARGNVGIGGLRSFIFFAALGAISAWLTRALDSPWMLAAATLAVTLVVAAGYVMQVRIRPDSLGLITELAALMVFLLGAMTLLGHPELAVGLAIVSSAVLAFKQRVRGAVQRLGWDDILAGSVRAPVPLRGLPALSPPAPPMRTANTPILTPIGKLSRAGSPAERTTRGLCYWKLVSS